MKKIISILLFLCLSATAAPVTVELADGRTVQINDDGTWDLVLQSQWSDEYLQIDVRGWIKEKKPLNDDHAVSFSRTESGSYFSVINENLDADINAYTNLLKKAWADNMEDFKVEKTVPFKLKNRFHTQMHISGRVEGVKFFYVATVFSRPDGFSTIIGWTGSKASIGDIENLRFKTMLRK